MDAYDKLVEGYKVFRDEYLGKSYDAYRAWASKGQSPRTMFIGCSDSRVNPAILTQAGLGEIFTVNNVANIVPPYEEGDSHHKSLGAAIQFAVTQMKVDHVIVMGHSGCGGVAALMNTDFETVCKKGSDYITDWVSLLLPARQVVEAGGTSLSENEKMKLAEMESVLVSLKNLSGYPWVQEAVANNELHLHAWYFQINTGELFAYNSKDKSFKRLAS